MLRTTVGFPGDRVRVPAAYLRSYHSRPAEMLLDRLITRIWGGLALTTHQKGIPKVSEVFGHDGG